MKKMAICALMGLSTATFAASNFNGYIVKFKKGSQAYSQKSLQNFGNFKPLNLAAGNFAKLESNLNPANKSLDMLRNHPEVEYIEPNYIYSVNPIESHEKSISDVKFDSQWGLKNTGKNSGGWFSRGKAGEDVNAENAWTITTGSKEVVVAVIDTGVDHSHEDLKDQMWTNDAELNGVEGIDDDGNGFVDDVYGYDFVNKDGDPMDDNNHGTHCAGVIGASHNSIGVRGVMANVKIMGIKFLSRSGSGETIDAIKSIDYAVQNGAHILSNSWGGGENSKALEETIENAAKKGVLFVAAAGNSRSDNDKRPTYPAAYTNDNMITVGSMDGKGKRSGFSNYGEKTVHVFAPGSNILSTVPNNRYKKLSGTSMATPFVAGVLGLLYSEEPGIDFKTAKERIMMTTVNNEELEGLAQRGRVDAFRMLRDERN